MGREYKQITIEERCEIARLRTEGHGVRQIAASLDRSPSTIARELKRNRSSTEGYKPVYADEQARARGGVAPSWSVTTLCGSTSSHAWKWVGLQSRWLVAWPWSLANVSSLTRPSTGSSTHRSHAGRTTPGVTTCHMPSPDADAGVARAKVPHHSSPIEGHWQNAPHPPPTARPLDTGRPT